MKTRCCICREPMGEADIKSGTAIIATGPVEDVWMHVRHISTDGKNKSADYEANMRKMAVEYAARNGMLPVTRN